MGHLRKGDSPQSISIANLSQMSWWRHARWWWGSEHASLSTRGSTELFHPTWFNITSLPVPLSWHSSRTRLKQLTIGCSQRDKLNLGCFAPRILLVVKCATCLWTVVAVCPRRVGCLGGFLEGRFCSCARAGGSHWTTFAPAAYRPHLFTKSFWW